MIHVYATSPLTTLSRYSFIQIIARIKQPSFAKDRRNLLIGMLSLSDIVHLSDDATSPGTAVMRSWGEERIENIISMAMDCWIESPTTDQVVRYE